MTNRGLEPQFVGALVPAFLQVFGTDPAGSTCEPSAGSTSSSPWWRIPPNRDLANDPLLASLANEGSAKAAGLVAFLRGYHDHVTTIGLGLDDLPAYLRQQRQLLSNIYGEARQPVPSPATIRSLVLQYALDARHPVVPPIGRFDVRQRAGVCEVGEWSAGSYRSTVLPPPGGYRPVTVPFGGWLVTEAYRLPLQPNLIVALAEGICGGCPSESGVLEASIRPAEPPAVRRPVCRGKNIDAQMLKVIAENVESYCWSARVWAEVLGCSDGTVKGTKTWKERLPNLRTHTRAEAGRRMNRDHLIRRDRHGHKDGNLEGAD